MLINSLPLCLKFVHVISSHVLILPTGMMVFMAVLGMKKMIVKVAQSMVNCLERKLWVLQKIIVATASKKYSL